MSQKLKKTADFLFVIIFLIVLAQILYYFWQKTPLIIAAVPVLFWALYQFRKKITMKPVNYRKAWVCVQGVSILALLYIVTHLEVKLTWDWGLVINTAYAYVTTGGIDNSHYYAMYPNNCPWLLCLIFFFRIVKKLFNPESIRGYKTASMILGGVLTEASLLLVYLTARMKLGEKKGFFTGCLMAAFLPVYLYAQIAYTDVPAMFIAALILFLVLCLRQGRVTGKARYLLMVILGVAAAAAFMIKVTAFILVIALLIEALLERIRDRRWRPYLLAGLILAVSFAGTTAAVQKMVTHVVPVSAELKDEYELPLTHWVMMGLRGSGGFSQKEVDYTLDAGTYDEKVEANIKKIFKRLKKRGILGTAQFIFGKKLIYSWCGATLGGSYYGTKYPYEKNTLWQYLSNSGVYFKRAQFFECIYYLLLMSGVFLSGVFALADRKKEDSFWFACRTALLGLFLFLAVWEANSRQLVTFIPILILTAADRILELSAWFQRGAWKRKLPCRLEKKIRKAGESYYE